MGTIITSRANPQIKNIIQLKKDAGERRRQGVFLTEGIRMFTEVPPAQRLAAYVSEAFLKKEEYRRRLAAIEYQVVSDAVFHQMSDTKTPQGIMCMARMPAYGMQDLLRQGKTQLLILEGIQDPGNLGTMFRTAEGAGATGVLMDRTCVDIFSPKTIRATMGSIFRVPFFVTDDLPDTIRELKKQYVIVYAAHLDGKRNYDAFDYCGGCAFLIGNEGAGLTEETAKQADAYLRIPMEGRVESLNAAMAAGILMYEAYRQRRQRGR